MLFTVDVALQAIIFFLNTVLSSVSSETTGDPKFVSPIDNVTVPIHREAILTCVVQDLGSYKVAWLRVDTQTILTIQNHVITKNDRIGITYSEHKTWQLKIRNVREEDRAWYMCQINTDPMKSQLGYLDVVVPPDILDDPNSSTNFVNEGSNVTLKCAATGSPTPRIIWRREGAEPISLPDGVKVLSWEGPNFMIPRVNRLQMGAYLCIASNGVPPTVSKRVMLTVHFPPMIWVPNQLLGAVEGQRVTLECQSEAYPKSINYWVRERGEIVPQGGKFEPVLVDNAYKVVMKLSIKAVSQSDFGSYKCVAKNSLGETDGTIKLYKIPRNTINAIESNDARLQGKARKGGNYYDSNDIADDDPENMGKRKDIILNGNNDESYEISATSAQQPHDKRTLNIILAITTAVQLSTAMRRQ